VTAPTNLRATGDRIEQLIGRLEATLDGPSFDVAEDLLRSVTELYGAGLARMVELAAGSPGLIDDFAGDELVSSLLLVHGLHPRSLEARVEEALAHVRPMLAAHQGDVELLDIDPSAGAVRLRLLGSCDGCPSSSVTLQLAVERAIVDAAPEIIHIDVDEPSPAPPHTVPVTMSTKSPPLFVDGCPAEVADA
jgi:Fe-S cluster biogenesis protein NfuA